MRLPLALSAAALIAMAAAACSGGQSSNYVAPPAAGVAAGSVNGPVTLSTSGTIESAGTANGVTGALTFGPGTGTVTSVSSAFPPAGTSTVVPASRDRVILASATSPNVYYVTITSPGGATLSGLPAVNLALSTAAVGTYQEAQWNGTAYVNVTGATATTNTADTAVAFPQTTAAITIPANGSIYLAFYQGNYPNATPTPVATPTNVIADSGFESGVYAPYGSTVSSTGWTVCSVTQAAAGVSFPSNRYPYTTYTPLPGTTPAAVIDAAGTTIPQGTKTPAPLTSVLAHSGTKAAVFGQLFNNYNAGDWLYNGLCQAIKMPQQPTLTMSILGTGTENSSTYFALDISVLDSTGKFLSELYDENSIATAPPGDSAYRTVTVPTSSLQPYAGQNVQMFVGIWTKAGSSSNSMVYSGYYFVDDFLLSGIPR